MRIVVFHPHRATAIHWLEALRAQLPAADVYLHTEGNNARADYAAGWAPPEDFFRIHRELKAFFTTGAGVDRILSDPSVPASMPIVRLEDAGMGAQMADYCVLEALRWMRLRDAYDVHKLERKWRPLPAEDSSHWPVGVFGLGQLGLHVARAFVALGFPVNGYSRTPQSHPDIACYADNGGAGDFTAFMGATRVLVIVAPLTEATRDLFGRAWLAKLQPSSYVINVARGALLVDEALIELLDNGHIAGAALDVFRKEPLPKDDPFWHHPRIRITPHIAAETLVEPSARQVADKILSLERGENITGIVDRQRGY